VQVLGLTFLSGTNVHIFESVSCSGRLLERADRRYRRRAIILASDHFLNCKSWQQCGSKFKKMIASWFWIFSTSSSLASSFSNHRCTDYKKKIKDLCSDYNRSTVLPWLRLPISAGEEDDPSKWSHVQGCFQVWRELETCMAEKWGERFSTMLGFPFFLSFGSAANASYSYSLLWQKNIYFLISFIQMHMIINIF
jgi:hypothetical protein